MKALADNELKALIKLAGDEDESSSSGLLRQLADIVRLEPERIETIITTEFADKLPPAVSTLLEESRWRSLENMFRNLSRSAKNPDLEEGLFLISKFAFQKISLADISTPLDAIAAEARERVSNSQDLPRIVAFLSDVVYHKHALRGADPKTQNPEDTYLYNLLKNKTGMPITLGSLYILLGKRLNLPIHGMGIPGHFLVQYKTWNGDLFLDPYQEGRVVSPRECQMMVLSRGVHWDPEFLNPVDNRYILCRTLGNLIYEYNRSKDERRSAQLKRYLQILQD